MLLRRNNKILNFGGMYLLLRLLINALALLVVTQLVAGFSVDTFYHALIAAIVLGIINAVLRPVLVLLTLPINLLTLGLFTFVINGALIWFVGTFVKGVEISGFLPALIAAILLWAISTLSNMLVKATDKI